MLKKIIKFIKYNNATVLILALFFIVGSGVFAQTETGQELIGEKVTYIEGRDNTLLIEADLDNFQMDFKIENIEEDEKYYYIKYTSLDLLEYEDAWQYQINEKIRKVSKKFQGDLGEYMAEELKEEYDARIKILKEEQAKALMQGKEIRREITEYSGLIGKTLSVVAKVFSDYDPVKEKIVLSPEKTYILANEQAGAEIADDLIDVYSEYMKQMDPDEDEIVGLLDNCPDVANPEQEDKDGDGLGDACDEFFTLKPAEEDLYKNIDQTDTASGTIVSSIDDTTATSTDDIIATGTDEIISVEIIELDEIDNKTASGT